MLGGSAPRIPPLGAIGVRVRALFDEAWRRARRRRRLMAVVLIGMAAIAGGLTVAVGGQPDRVAPPVQKPATLTLPKAPGMGVACPRANSIACDRIGIAVWLDGAPQRLIATIGGHSVLLRDLHITCGDHGPCPRLFTGELHPAGLLDGVLRVTPDEGRYSWFGRHPVVGTLQITATYRDGTRAVTTRRVPLAPGWG